MKNQMVFFEEEFNEDHKKSFQILYCSDHFLSIATNIVLAQEPRVFLRIDKEFFDALNNDKQNLNKAYSNNPKCKSEEYLGHIAVLIKYMEESNIEILKKQGKIIKN